MTKTTKIVLGIIIGITVLLIGWIIASYILSPTEPGAPRRTFLLFPSGTDEPPAGGEGTAPAGISGGAEARLIQIVKDPVVGAVLTKDGRGILFYRRAGGNVFQTDLEGKSEVKLSGLTVLGITDVRWSPARQAALVAYAADSELKYFIQTISTSSANTVFLPRNVTSASWSPDGSRISYTRIGGKGSELVTIDARGAGARTVYSRPSPDWRSDWVGTTTILLSTVPSRALPGNSVLFGLGQGAADFLSAPGLQILSAFPANTYAVFSTSPGGEPAPLLFRKRAGERIGTSDVKTLAEKCAWNVSLALLYCAVPEGAHTGLPDNWYQGKVQFRDKLIRINRTSGAYETILPPSSVDAVNLLVSPDEKYLFFINKADSTLWRLELSR